MSEAFDPSKVSDPTAIPTTLVPRHYEHRKTFTVPEGHIPVLDAEGRATGGSVPASPATAAFQTDVKAAIADEAKRIVTGARRANYGKPEQNFERIARFWQAYFENTGRPEAKVTAADVSPLMRLMKEARLCETPNHRDSFVDLVGYTLTGAEVNEVSPT